MDASQNNVWGRERESKKIQSSAAEKRLKFPQRHGQIVNLFFRLLDSSHGEAASLDKTSKHLLMLSCSLISLIFSGFFFVCQHLLNNMGDNCVRTLCVYPILGFLGFKKYSFCY